MTSDCAGDQVSRKPDGSTSVKATGAIGGHDRLNEAPRCICSTIERSFLGHLRRCPKNPKALRDGQPG